MLTENHSNVLGKCIFILMGTVILWQTGRGFIDASLRYGMQIIYIIQILLYLIMFLGLIVFVKFIEGWTLHHFSFGLEKEQRLPIFICALIGSLVRILKFIAISPFGYAEFSSPNLSPPQMILAPVTGFVEESIFRGYIQRKLSIKYRTYMAIPLTAFFFMVYHINFESLTEYISLRNAWLYTVFLFGIFIGCVYEKMGRNLLNVVAFHTFYNLQGIITPIKVGTPFSYGYNYIVSTAQWGLAALIMLTFYKLFIKKPSKLSQSPKTVVLRKMLKNKVYNHLLYLVTSSIFSFYLLLCYYYNTPVLSRHPPRRVEIFFGPITFLITFIFVLLTLCQLIELGKLIDGKHIIRGLAGSLMAPIAPMIILKQPAESMLLPFALALFYPQDGYLNHLQLVLCLITPLLVFISGKFKSRNQDHLLMACGLLELTAANLLSIDYFTLSLAILPFILMFYSSYELIKASHLRNEQKRKMVILSFAFIIATTIIQSRITLSILPYLLLTLLPPTVIVITILAHLVEPHRNS